MTSTNDIDVPLWVPTADHIRSAQLTAYRSWLHERHGLEFESYDALWQWSIDELEMFWQTLWDYFGIQSDTPYDNVLAARVMPGARWFEGATLNYAREVFRHSTPDRPAVIVAGEDRAPSPISWESLEQQVAAIAHGLRGMGVVPGDRVVAYLPNVPQTLAIFLACASVGAIWSVCSPDMGPVAVLDRFSQIKPKVMFACAATRYAGQWHDRREVLANLKAGLPTLEQLVVVPMSGEPAPPDAQAWQDLLAVDVPLEIESLPFEHPLWVVYSSGTTGLPKPIVHGHGGVLLEGLKGGVLHNDLRPTDVFFWYSSTGWIMWNSQIGGLALGATVCCYDGHPGTPDQLSLWRFAAEAKVTFFGAGAAFFMACMKSGLRLNDAGSLGTLRAVGSTGSPLPPEAYRWLQAELGPSVWLTAIAGGTDFAGAFLAGNITAPVYAGEMQCRSLGAAVYAFDEAGQPVTGTVGELVCTEPIPSMPLYLWGDTDGRRYHDSYFDTYPGVWRHGDWLCITERGGGIIYGRSDATINRHGIRMGTSELYRAVEALPEVMDSLVVDLEYLGRPSYMPLFVVLRAGAVLDDALLERIRLAIRTQLSARHVPNDIVEVPDVPRTLSGKKMELPIKKLMLGQALERVLNRDAMANAHCLSWYQAFANAYLARQTG